jgi:outer membrane lipopolysaccharide assembly protein LptE/RlpB
MLKKLPPRFFIFAVSVAALFSGCASYKHGEALPPLALDASPAALRADAKVALAAAGGVADANAGWRLHLREGASETILSRAESGAVSAYNVRYRLNFRLSNPAGEVVAERALSATRSVAHDESRYLAGRREREEVAAQLRRRALAQMIFQIRRLAKW